MLQMSAGWRQTIRRFRGLVWTGVALALGTALGTEEAQAQFVARDNTTGNAQGSTALGLNSTVVGAASTAGGADSTTIGNSSNADGSNATTIGASSNADGNNATTIGASSNANGSNATAIGRSANANFINSTALGFGSATTRDFQMMFGTGSNTYTMPGITSAASLAALSGSGQFVTSDASGNLVVSNVNTNRVGFGTFSPDANSRMDIRSSTLINGLLVKRTDAGAHYLRIEDSSGSTFRCGVQGNGDTQFGALTAGKGLALVAGGTGKFAINASGQVSFGGSIPANPSGHAVIHTSGAHLTTGGVWTNSSSRALKQDIEPITSAEARETVRALQPVGYRYKNELNERYVGFIAEDVPELVATRDRKGLASMDITAVLTKVVQDQDRELSEQKRINAELSDRLLKLEQQLGLRAATDANGSK